MEKLNTTCLPNLEDNIMNEGTVGTSILAG